MKKISLIVVMALMLLLAACSAEKDAGEKEVEKDVEKEVQEEVEKDTEKEEKETVEVDKGLLNVEITIPAAFFEGEDIDELIAEAKEEGVADIKQNDDGTLTYKMSKAKHKELMAEMKKELDELVEELKTSEDFVSIKDVTYNKSFSEFTFVVNKEAFESGLDGFAAFGVVMSSMFYQMFNGADYEKNKVTMYMKDEATGEIFDTVIYPDALEETE